MLLFTSSWWLDGKSKNIKLYFLHWLAFILIIKFKILIWLSRALYFISNTSFVISFTYRPLSISYFNSVFYRFYRLIIRFSNHFTRVSSNSQYFKAFISSWSILTLLWMSITKIEFYDYKYKIQYAILKKLESADTLT